MYSMQGIVRKSVNNVTTQFEKLGYVANSLANKIGRASCRERV